MFLTRISFRRKRTTSHRMDKKGIELSINFLVILILGVAMLTLGIWLLGKFFVNIQAFEVAVTEREREQMLQLVADKDLAVFPESVKVAAGKDADYLIAVHNKLPGDARIFLPVITFMYAIDKTDTQRCVKPDGAPAGTTCTIGPTNFKPDDWLVTPAGIPIRNAETGILKVRFKVHRAIPAWIYVFQVCIPDPSKPAGTTCDPAVPSSSSYGGRTYIKVAVT
jgi:hypothetical protein